MAYILSYLLMYGPPLVCGYLYYRHEKKKQDRMHQKNYIMLYLVPFVVFTVMNILWSMLLYGVALVFTQA